MKHWKNKITFNSNQNQISQVEVKRSNEKDEYSKNEPVNNNKSRNNDIDEMLNTNYGTEYESDKTPEELRINDNSSEKELNQLSFNEFNVDDNQTILINDYEMENPENHETNKWDDNNPKPITGYSGVGRPLCSLQR